MTNSALSECLRLGLEDLVAELVQARREGELARLALLCYCDVPHWARQVGEEPLAETSSRLFPQPTAHDRPGFLNDVDEVLAELEHLCRAISARGLGSSRKNR
jgi:hypothetical protein